ncbi:hypothetical protein FRC01_013753 [Tulasnella sp. 417]|nr:hypothetical protein FRC01_013753 [Tulasnella sp. 417]
MSQPALVQRDLDQNTNLVLPINRIPTEILVTIFEESIYTPELSLSLIPHVQKLHKLACVCLKWNRAVKETPSLWTVLESTTPRELVPHILQRSRQSPLVIKCCIVAGRQAGGLLSKAYGGARGLWDDIKSFLMIALLEIHRWRSALIRLSQADSEILEGLEKPAPLIEMVDIDIHECPQQANINLFDGRASNLRSVRLCGVPFIWSQGQFSDLHNLYISTTPSSQPALADVLMTIESSPHLRNLCLESLRMPASQGEDNLGAIKLDSLETLTLYRASSSVTQAILIRIRAPILQHLAILSRWDDGSNTSGQFIDRIPHFLPMIHSSINNANNVELTLRHSSISIRTSGNPRIDITIDHNSSAHTLQIFLRNIIHGSASRTPIRLSIAQVPEIEWSDLGKMLSSLDGVVELSVEDLRGDHQHDLFRFLSTPSDASGRGNSHLKWPFPYLKKLVLPFNTMGEQIVEFVKGRYDSGSLDRSGAGGLDEGIPCSPTTLDVGKVYLTQEQYNEISTTVGYAVVRGEVGYSYIFDS